MGGKMMDSDKSKVFDGIVCCLRRYLNGEDISNFECDDLEYAEFHIMADMVDFLEWRLGKKRLFKVTQRYRNGERLPACTQPAGYGGEEIELSNLHSYELAEAFLKDVYPPAGILPYIEQYGLAAGERQHQAYIKRLQEWEPMVEEQEGPEEFLWRKRDWRTELYFIPKER